MPASRPSAPAPEVRGRRRGALVVLVLLAALAAWSVLALQPPDPAPADAPPTSFSAARAAAHVEAVAGEVHVTGSPAQDRVVDGLVATLGGLGLDTRVQNAVGTRVTGPGAADLARVRNVVAVLPGTDPTGRLVLTASSDSAPTGPGAGSAAGVAVVVETVRALRAGEPLRNDVVVVVTDGGQACGCGAEAFAASHPLATGDGVVLDLDVRGAGGPAVVVATSPGPAARSAVGSSAVLELYRELPGGTGRGVLPAAPGLTLAAVDGAAGSGTPQDTPSRLDRGTLQALGDATLTLARELGDADLSGGTPPGDAGATWFPVPWGSAGYPGTPVWPLAGAAVLGVALLAALDRRRGSPPSRTLLGAAASLVPVVLAPLAVAGLWQLLVVLRPGYAAMADPWRPGWFRLAAVAVVAVVVLGWYGLLRRRLGAAALRTGALVVLAVLAVGLAARAPGASYAAALPALAAVLAGLLPDRARLGGAALAGAVAVGVLAPVLLLVFPASGLAAGAVPAAVAAVLALVLLPVWEELFPPGGGALRSVAVPGAAAGLAVLLAAVGLAVDRFDQQHPVPSRLAYVLEADTDEAWWVSTEERPGEYTARHVGTPRTLPHHYPYLGGPVAAAPAEVADLPAAAVEVLDDRVADGARTVTVRVRPQRAVRLVALDLDSGGGRVVSARAGARDVPAGALGEDRLRLTFHAPPPGGVELTVTVEDAGPLRLRVVDGSDGLTGLPGLEPRPPGVDAAGAPGSDLVVVGATTDLG
ncbi:MULTISPECIES: M28 family peptidase [unclassified Geodermatophilus]